MYPDLHQQVTDLLKKHRLSLKFHEIDNEASCIHDHDTHIMGRFDCRNPKCDSKGWSSKKIAITIRTFTGDKYNARVYHQRCQSCYQLSRPVLNKTTYAERVAYRLKKWNRIKVKPPPFVEKKGPPHQRELCEGCKTRHCQEVQMF